MLFRSQGSIKHVPAPIIQRVGEGRAFDVPVGRHGRTHNYIEFCMITDRDRCGGGTGEDQVSRPSDKPLSLSRMRAANSKSSDTIAFSRLAAKLPPDCAASVPSPAALAGTRPSYRFTLPARLRMASTSLRNVRAHSGHPSRPVERSRSSVQAQAGHSRTPAKRSMSPSIVEKRAAAQDRHRWISLSAPSGLI